METITFLFELMLLGLAVACLEMAFQMFMRPNAILYPYALLLLRLSMKNEVLRHIARPLGRCRYCNATWIAFYVYVYFYGYELPVLLMIGFTFLFLRLLDTKVLRNIDPNDEVEKEYIASFVTESEYDFDINGNIYLHAVSGNTPAIPMLWAYLILGLFYSIIYIVIPIIVG